MMQSVSSQACSEARCKVGNCDVVCKSIGVAGKMGFEAAGCQMTVRH